MLFFFTGDVLFTRDRSCSLLFTGDVFLVCAHDGLVSIIGHLLSCTGYALLSATSYIRFILCYDENGLISLYRRGVALFGTGMGCILILETYCCPLL